MPDQNTIKQVFSRVCVDSGYGLSAVNAAILVGKMLQITPLYVWLVIGWDNMQKLASGEIKIS